MSEKIWTAELAAEQLVQWLTPPRAATPFAILERIDGIDFPASDEAIDATLWTQGRIFGAAFELRWEKRGEVFGARVIGEPKINPVEPFQPIDIPLSALQDQWCFMWGEAEGRIGRKLNYRAIPPGKGRPCLLRRELWVGGKLLATRLVEMKMVDAQ